MSTTFAEKTDAEILARIAVRKPIDLLGFEWGELLAYLSFEYAKPYLKDEVESAAWTPSDKSREGVLKTMLDYMPFAWEKANNERGISACRSIMHYCAWLWMIGEDTGELACDRLEDYNYYGKPQLVAICERFGWDHKQWDDGVRSNGR
jgi:hypothetical protein